MFKKESKKNFIEMQPGDVECTSSDISNIKDWVNFSPNTSIELGVRKFANWYKAFYQN